ncbi:TPA: hypothetical protein ACX3IO_004492 [Vibrio parahaemolyticus]
MAYRIYRRESVNSGEWYFAVSCKSCEGHVYLLDDISKGKHPFLTGVKMDGDISTTCPRCIHDDLYPPNLVYSILANEDIASTYPKRTAISKSSRKPLSRFKPNAKVTMGVGYIEDRPKAAALVGRIVTAWADIDIQCVRLLGELMGANIPAAAAVFGSIRNSRSQHDALRAAAAAVLNKQDLLLFNAYIKRKEALEKERNDLAHGCFGVSLSIPDHIIWVSQSDFLAFTAAHQADVEPFDLLSKQYVYELGTLERIAQEISELHTQIGFFTGYLSARSRGVQGEEFRVKRYPELCNQEHIKQAVRVLQNQAKKNKR